jgi:outer membrane receptor for ferric coprogen and ferric-rhodotorulic acid
MPCIQPAPVLSSRRNVLRPHPLALALSIAFAPAAPALAAESVAPADSLPVVTITGKAAEPAYTVRAIGSAGKFELSPRETPQSVSVVTRAAMDDFKLDNANDVLASAGGVTVEKIETDRSYYTARGFDIINFQYDGVGLPLVFGNVMGDLDSAMYERIDIVRGANGLMTSTGNPSATINFIRKRPMTGLNATASLTLGSWDTRRLSGDLSAPLNASGTVAGRVVLVRQDGNSYLDRYAPKKSVAYGVVEARLGDNTRLTIGHSYQDNQADGAMWGALPLYFSDGSPTHYPRSASTSADWSKWNTETNASFAELRHKLGNGWSAQATLGRNTFKSRAKLFYVYGAPDRATGEGLFSYPSIYNSDNQQTLVDAFVTGQFPLAGRQHDLTFGLASSTSRLDDISLYGRGIGTPLTPQTGFTGAYPEPQFDASTDGSQFEDKRKSAYAAARFNLADNLKLLAGINTTRATSDGMAYGVSEYKSARKSTPYVGAVVDISANLSGYASYTRIFKPQSELDIERKTLAPVTGKNAELGVKGEFFNRSLNVSGAVFKTRQENAAEQAGYIGATPYYRGADAESTGAELELAGELARGWQASANFTQLSVKDNEGKAARTYLPRRLLRVSTTYRMPFVAGLKVGASLNWQDDTSRDQGGGIVTRQASYAVLGLMARYAIDRHLSLALNVNNATDKKYLASLYWAQGYYAAPRNASVTLNWQY